MTLDACASAQFRGRRRWAVRLAVTVLGLVSVGCFEDPVEDELDLCFAPDNRVLIVLHTRIRAQGGEDENALHAARIRDVERELLERDGAWSGRFDRLRTSLLDGTRWRRAESHLERYGRWSLVREADYALRDFFADLPVEVSYFPGAHGAGTAELSFHPTGGDRATVAQRRHFARELESFTARGARFYAATDSLWTYLASRPPRVRPALERLFDDLRGGDDEEAVAEPLTEHETTLVDEVIERREELLEIFRVAENDAYTVQEISRKLFDPFPGLTRVHVEGTVLESVGFERGDGGFAAPRTSLWDAIHRLDGLYASPDPFVLYVDAWLRDGELDLGEVIRTAELDSHAPTSGELRDALVEQLEPPRELRLVWREGPVQSSPEACRQAAAWD